MTVGRSSPSGCHTFSLLGVIVIPEGKRILTSHWARMVHVCNKTCAICHKTGQTLHVPVGFYQEKPPFTFLSPCHVFPRSDFNAYVSSRYHPGLDLL